MLDIILKITSELNLLKLLKSTVLSGILSTCHCVYSPRSRYLVIFLIFGLLSLSAIMLNVLVACVNRRGQPLGGVKKFELLFSSSKTQICSLLTIIGSAIFTIRQVIVK